jgi:hypothetical protein
MILGQNYLVTRSIEYPLLFTFQAKRPLRNPRHRYVDDIKMDFRVMGCIPMDWITLVQDRDY